ncbi:L-lysine permease [Klebsiella pneumoniae]|nr:L-lysine permease [Klebsiella pneumoniae]
MLMLFLTVALVHIIALMSPGPDFFFVSQTAISRSRREAMMGVLGITCGVMVWAGVALLGLNLILARMAWLHNIIMVGGGLYLCWMGYQMLRGALKKETVASAEPQVELARSGRSFVKGLLTNLANPKAIIYFGSVFSLFVGDSVGAGARWGIFLLIIVRRWPGLWWLPACSPCRGCAAAISGWRSGSTVSPVRCLRASAST